MLHGLNDVKGRVTSFGAVFFFLGEVFQMKLSKTPMELLFLLKLKKIKAFFSMHVEVSHKNHGFMRSDCCFPTAAAKKRLQAAGR